MRRFALLLENTGQLRPFITISFGGFIDPRKRVNGIVGARTHTHDATFVVRTVG